MGLHQRLTEWLLREWVILFCVISVAVVVMDFAMPHSRLNLMTYDVYMNLMRQKPHPDVVIIGIDNPSINQLGRWPWSRRIHAKMLNKLNGYSPRAVALDLIFSEPESPVADQHLADELKKFSAIFLPVAASEEGATFEDVRPLLPIPLLQEAVTGVGHIGVRLDHDSIVRSTYLWEGRGAQMWPHLMWQMVKSQSPSAKMPVPTIKSQTEIGRWRRKDVFNIPFRGPSYWFPIYSYAQVLNGEVSPTAFKDKYVLVGVTAQSLGDNFATSTSSNGVPMPGVEVHANTLAAFLDKKAFHEIGWFLRVMLPILILGIFFYHLIFSKPASAISLLITLLVGCFLLGYWFLSQWQIWWSPVAVCLGLMVAYPIWSWRRLETVIEYMGEEAVRLSEEQSMFPETTAVAEHELPWLDTVGGKIDALNRSIERHRNLREFMQSSMQNLPDVLLVTDLSGQLLVFNHHAQEFFTELGVRLTPKMGMQNCLADLALAKIIQPVGAHSDVSLNWYEILPRVDVVNASAGPMRIVEIVTTHRQRYLLKVSAIVNQRHEVLGWLMSFLDMTILRAAEKQRDDFMQFLMRDLRQPLDAVLSLLKNRRMGGQRDWDKVLSGIEDKINRSIELTDDFAMMTKAVHNPFTPHVVSIGHLVSDALFHVRSLIEQKCIKIHYSPSADWLYVMGEYDLLHRALVIVLQKAVLCSADHSPVAVTVEVIRAKYRQQEDWVRLQVIDHGTGIASEEQKQINSRGHVENSLTTLLGDQRSVGMGLNFVRAVMDKHRGRVVVDSQANVSTQVCLELPIMQMEPETS